MPDAAGVVDLGSCFKADIAGVLQFCLEGLEGLDRSRAVVSSGGEAGLFEFWFCVHDGLIKVALGFKAELVEHLLE